MEKPLRFIRPFFPFISGNQKNLWQEHIIGFCQESAIEIAWKQSYLFTRELSEDLQTCELEYFYELDLDELAYAGLTL